MKVRFRMPALKTSSKSVKSSANVHHFAHIHSSTMNNHWSVTETMLCERSCCFSEEPTSRSEDIVFFNHLNRENTRRLSTCIYHSNGNEIVTISLLNRNLEAANLGTADVNDGSSKCEASGLVLRQDQHSCQHCHIPTSNITQPEYNILKRIQ